MFDTFIFPGIPFLMVGLIWGESGWPGIFSYFRPKFSRNSSDTKLLLANQPFHEARW